MPTRPPALRQLSSTHALIEQEITRLERAVQVCERRMVDRYDAAAGALGLAGRRLEALLALHLLDEEGSLHPRLREVVPDRRSWLDMLVREHERGRATWLELLPQLETLRGTLEEGGDPDQRLVAAIAHTLARWSGCYRAHLALEHRELWPLASHAVDAEGWRAIAHELAQHRGAPPAATPRAPGPLQAERASLAALAGEGAPNHDAAIRLYEQACLRVAGTTLPLHLAREAAGHAREAGALLKRYRAGDMSTGAFWVAFDQALATLEATFERGLALEARAAGARRRLQGLRVGPGGVASREGLEAVIGALLAGRLSPDAFERDFQAGLAALGESESA
jgi:hypothetical protein